MGNLLFFLLLSGGGALALAAAYALFEISIFIAYKLSGGRLDLIAYIKKL
jgi:hypothetical protein